MCIFSIKLKQFLMKLPSSILILSLFEYGQFIVSKLLLENINLITCRKWYGNVSIQKIKTSICL